MAEAAPEGAEAVPKEQEPAPAADAAPATDATPSAEAPAADATPAAEAPAAEPPAAAGETPAATEATPAPAADATPAAEAPAAADAAPAETGEGSAAPAADSAEASGAAGEASADASGAAGYPGGSEAYGEHTASSPRAAADDGGPLDRTETVNVEVPELRVDVTGRTQSGGLPQGEKLCSAVEDALAKVQGAMSEFDGSSSDDPEVRNALSDWKARLDSHVAELQTIMKVTPKTSPVGGETTMALPSAEQQEEVARNEEEFENELDTVRSMGHELESQRTGREVDDVASAWADPEETHKEVAELRRVRRQIRYLFGGMIGSLPESTTLRVDDLLSDRDAMGTESPQASRAPPRPQGDLERGLCGTPKAKMAEVGYLKAANVVAPGPDVPFPGPSPRQAQSRPRSGGTESVSNSSVGTWNSQSRRDADPEEQQRRSEQKEQRRQQKRHREHRSDAPREMKRDDGAMPIPSKQWNWAEEVVKASLDPGNQWEFPSADDGRGPGVRGPQWEQPRQAPRGPGQRGNDIALKTRERAEEVMRSERDRKRNLYDPSDGLEVAGYR